MLDTTYRHGAPGAASQVPAAPVPVSPGCRPASALARI